MSIRIIDNKKIELTNDEFAYYQKICRSYDDVSVNRKGEDLFVDLFEVNGDGIIIFVKPPTKRYSSMEVYLFLISIMQNQHMRIVHEEVHALVNEAKKRIDEIVTLAKNKIEKLSRPEESR